MTQDTPSPPLEITCAELHRRMAGDAPPLLIDCREPDEYALVSIAGAVLLPMSSLQERVGELETHRSSDVVVFCHHGMRSQHVSLWLRQQGFDRVQSLAGGIDRWASEIDPSLPRY